MLVLKGLIMLLCPSVMQCDTTLHYSTQHYITLHCNNLHYTTLLCTLNYTTIHCTTLHWTTLHYTPHTSDTTYTLNTAFYTLHSTHCTVCSAFYTLHTTHYAPYYTTHIHVTHDILHIMHSLPTKFYLHAL